MGEGGSWWGHMLGGLCWVEFTQRSLIPVANRRVIWAAADTLCNQIRRLALGIALFYCIFPHLYPNKYFLPLFMWFTDKLCRLKHSLQESLSFDVQVSSIDNVRNVQNISNNLYI